MKKHAKGEDHPLLGHILQSFAEEEDSEEINMAIKTIRQSPIIGQVIMQMFVKMKELQN